MTTLYAAIAALIFAFVIYIKREIVFAKEGGEEQKKSLRYIQIGLRIFNIILFILAIPWGFWGWAFALSDVTVMDPMAYSYWQWNLLILFFYYIAALASIPVSFSLDKKGKPDAAIFILIMPLLLALASIYCAAKFGLY